MRYVSTRSALLLFAFVMAHGLHATLPKPDVESPESAPAPINTRGKQLYFQMCAGCHMADGSGVPNFQPALTDSAVVRGDPGVLIRTILQGPAAVLPADRPKYSNVMPGFAASFKDAQAADLITYLRQAFGNSASAITREQVRAERSAMH